MSADCRMQVSVFLGGKEGFIDMWKENPVDITDLTADEESGEVTYVNRGEEESDRWKRGDDGKWRMQCE